jgi:hypothetical protein
MTIGLDLSHIVPPAPRRVLVTGGRDYADRAYVYATLDRIHKKEGGIAVLIHGKARGADTLAEDWADDRVVPVNPYPADWYKDGPSAGPVRNTRMLKESQPDLVVAFPGGKGTADMTKKAIRAGVEIKWANGA